MDRTRDSVALVAALLALGVAVIGGVSASAWVGKVFPGFLLLENRVVASAGLAHWPAVAGGEIYQQEVRAVDGVPLSSASELHDRVEAQPAGTVFTYRLRSRGEEGDLTIQSRTFEWSDFGLLFGSYLVCGLGLTGAAITVRYLRRRDPAARGSAVSLWIIGMWALTATDLYGPYRLFEVHAFLECILFAATLQLALVFPSRRKLVVRFPRLVPMLYGAGFALGGVAVAGLQEPTSYVLTHRIALAAFGASMLALIASQLLAWIRPASFQARQRVKILALGTVAALTPQVILSLGAANSGQASENLMGWSGIFFPLSIGYAVLRSDLLQVDAILRRTVNYALLTLGVAIAYAGTVAALEEVVGDNFGTGWGSAFVFALVSVGVLLPLRDHLQSFVDRVFFRSTYDFRRLVEGASRRLASATDLAVIADEIQRTVTDALQPESIEFKVRAAGEPRLSSEVARRWLPDDAERLIEPGARAIELAGGELLTGLIADGRLVGLLFVGRRLSGEFYSGDDRRLLHTLANQGAVAIENALAVEQVRDLNRSLEHRVEERTRELAQALRELQETQRKLVHQEKMASIGQLVAGVAHEINNPLNFIKGNLYLLREYADGLTAVISGYQTLVEREAKSLTPKIESLREAHDVDYVVEDLGSLLEACDEGVERTTRIVSDLRAFSRIDGGVTAEIDLAGHLDTTLNLLRSRLTGLVVDCDYADAGIVECLEGQIDQVFMNLIVNAADAVGAEGHISIRSHALGSDRVVIEVEDDGCGIEPEETERIFEPFFTTKDVGEGTGLGLAISYGVVSRHGGRIDVRSVPGEGTCFSVELPRVFPDQSPLTEAPSSGATDSGESS